MRRIRKVYIHQHDDWPDFHWDGELLSSLVGEVRNLQGRLLGKMENLGFTLQNDAQLESISLDVIKSNEIEGNNLNMEEVRSSVARQLGMDFNTTVKVARDVDGVVEMLLDATQNYTLKLTENRLFDWHAALFPTGRSGMHSITVADWRKDGNGPMQVVSGAMGKERIHFEAPECSLVSHEMELFFKWFNSETKLDPVLKAGVAHLWFLSIHPFDDGNGRIARAVTDLQLARSDKTSKRFYSMSAQILLERKGYYSILEKTQKGKLDITEWLVWFLKCLRSSILASKQILSAILQKADYWKTHSDKRINERQQKMINKLFDGFEGKLTTSKWAKMTKSSQDTALRDIQDLIEKKMLKKESKGGRSTSYSLKLDT